MKAWNDRHPNAVLGFFIFLCGLFSLDLALALKDGEWFWVVLNLLAFLYAMDKAEEWYHKTGKEEEK